MIEETIEKKKRTRKKAEYTSRAARALARQQEVRHQRIMLGCALAAVVIIVLLAVFLPRAVLSPDRGRTVDINPDVLSYQAKVEAACEKYDISEYAVLMLAIMQQESSGQGTDVFQCSESPFNTEYSNAPGSITDVDYSIDVGAQTFAYCLEVAGCKHISDMNRVKIALQEYNFGNDYASWAITNYGGYSEENAAEFSALKCAQLGWSSYGDPEYVAHVLRYYER